MTDNEIDWTIKSIELCPSEEIGEEETLKFVKELKKTRTALKEIRSVILNSTKAKNRNGVTLHTLATVNQALGLEENSCEPIKE